MHIAFRKKKSMNKNINNAESDSQYPSKTNKICVGLILFQIIVTALTIITTYASGYLKIEGHGAVLYRLYSSLIGFIVSGLYISYGRKNKHMYPIGIALLNLTTSLALFFIFIPLITKFDFSNKIWVAYRLAALASFAFMSGYYFALAKKAIGQPVNNIHLKINAYLSLISVFILTILSVLRGGSLGSVAIGFTFDFVQSVLAFLVHISYITAFFVIYLLVKAGRELGYVKYAEDIDNNK